ADPELGPDPLHIDGLSFVREARIAGDDKEPTNARQRGNDLLDHAVDEIFLPGVAAHVLKRQHRDRWLVGQGGARILPRRCRAGSSHRSVRPDGTRDVLERLLAHFLEGEIEATRRILLYPRRNKDAGWLGQTFEAGRNVDATAEDVAVLDDDVAILMPTRNSI